MRIQNLIFGDNEHVEVPITRDLLVRGVISALVGVVMGIVISMVVNITLVEISLSSFFAMYFGALFLIVGALMLWRVSRNHEEDDPEKKYTHLVGFALLIVVSGFICFFLDRNWFVGISSWTKVPVYTVLGVSVAFAMAFTMVDSINYVVGLFQANAAKPLLESEAQIRLVLSLALLMGAIFGFIFGLMDVEDAATYQIHLALRREENYCYPIGAVLGAVAGFGNEYVKKRDDIVARTDQYEFDNEI